MTHVTLPLRQAVANFAGRHQVSGKVWTRRYFDELFAKRYSLLYPSEHATRVAQALESLLALRPESRVLDVGCGNGRYSLALAADGFAVTGIDTSRVLLSRARRLAARHGLDVTWQLADMRQLDFHGTFDACIVISSLGFFESDAENEAAMARIVESLRPGGRVFVRLLNGVYAAGHFRPADTEQIGHHTISCSRQLKARPAAIVETIEVSGPKGCRAYDRYQRLFATWDVEQLLSRAGAAVTAFYGDYDRTPFDHEESPDLIAVAERTRR
jgi:2-polyprenyl-3-methyl-5-hydroxy-6-metoxy-1,4-benzoquinol methylase